MAVEPAQQDKAQQDKAQQDKAQQDKAEHDKAPHGNRDAASRLAQATPKLTEQQRHEVADFAEFLAERSAPTAAPVQEQPHAEHPGPRKMDLEKLRGSLAHLKDQYKSGVELQHAIMREDWGNVD